MAKIPQLSSSAPSVVTPLRGQLSLPTNFPTPVTSKGVSNAFASLANTASNLGEFKQQLFDREQATYRDLFFSETEDALNGFLDGKIKEVKDSLRSEENPYTYADGDSPVYNSIESWFENENSYNQIEGFRSLTGKNRDSVLTRLRRSFRNESRRSDNTLRGESEKIASDKNAIRYRRELAGTDFTFKTDAEGNPKKVNDSYANAAQKTFLLYFQEGRNQGDFDKVSNDIVDKFLDPKHDELFLKNPSAYSKYAEIVIDLLSDAEGNPYSPDAVHRIKAHQRTITNKNSADYKRFAGGRGSEISSEFVALSKAGDEDFSDPSRMLAQAKRAEDLANLGFNHAEGDFKEYLTEPFYTANKNAQIEDASFKGIVPILYEGILPEDHPSIANADLLERAEIQKAFSESSFTERLLVAEDYWKAVQQRLSSDLKDPNAEFQQRAVARILSKVDDYKHNFTGDDQVKELLTKVRTFKGDANPFDLMSMMASGEKVGGFDSSKVKLTNNELAMVAEHNNRLRRDRNYRDQFTPSQIENFQIMFAANSGNNEEAQMESFFGTSIEGLSEMSADVPSYVSDPRYFGRQILGPKAGLAFTSLTDKLLTYAHVVLEQDSDYKAELENYKKIAGDKLNRGRKEKARKALENKLFKKVASLTGRNYIEHGYQQLFVDKEDFSISENKRNSDMLEVGRVLASNTAIGPEMAKVIDNISKGFAIRPTTYGPVSRGLPSNKIHWFKKEEVIKMLEEADLENTHPAVYQGLLDTVKNAPNDDSIPRALKQWLEGVRDGTSIKVTQMGKVHYEFKPHESGRAITTRSHSSSTIPVFVGEAGMLDVATRSMGAVDKVLTGEAFFDEEDVFDLPVDTLIETKVAYEERAKELLDTTAWSSAATIGETSSNGLVRVAKYSDNFKAYRIEQPIADIIDEEKRSSNVARTPGFSETHYGRQGAHVFRRSMAPILNLYANALDVKENIESSSIYWNQVIQEVPEREKMEEIFEWVDSTDTTGLVGRWDIVTYSPPLPAIEKPEFFGVQEVKDVPSMSHLEWRFRAVNPETDAVINEWTITITDEKVLSMMQRSELYTD